MFKALEKACWQGDIPACNELATVQTEITLLLFLIICLCGLIGYWLGGGKL